MRIPLRKAFGDLARALNGRLRDSKAAMRGLAVVPVVALLVSASAGAVAPPHAEQSKPIPYGQGLLWKIERAGLKPSFLFGTMHLSYADIVNLPAPVKTAFDQADSASFEIEMTEESAARWDRTSYYRGWQTLDAELGPDLYAEVIGIAEPYGLTIHELRKFKPWVVIFYLSQPPGVYVTRKAGEKKLDQWLHDEAKKQKKAVYGLETIEEHVGVFADLPQDVQRKVIRAMVKQDRIALRTTQSTLHERMVQLYLERDIAAILNMDSGMAAGAGEEINRMIEERLLDQRNHLMVERMIPRLKEGKAFVAVGAAHLPGEQGMVNLLVQQGYKVTRVY